MSDELFHKIMEELTQFPDINSQKGRFHPYFMQEPFLDKRIVEKMGIIHDYFPQTNISVSTNPIPLVPAIHDEIVEFFSRVPRHEFMISYHGINAASLDHIMQIDFERAEQNVIQFLKKAGGRINIELKGLGTSRFKDLNYFSEEDYQEYWARLFDREQIDTTTIKVHFALFHDRAGSIQRDERNASNVTVGKVREIDAEHPFYCPQIDKWVQITWDGSLRWCCMDWHHTIELPNLKDTTLVEYFASNQYKQLYDMVLGKTESPDDFICKRCTWPINDDGGKHMQNLLIQPSATDGTRQENWPSGGKKQPVLYQLNDS